MVNSTSSSDSSTVYVLASLKQIIFPARRQASPQARRLKGEAESLQVPLTHLDAHKERLASGGDNHNLKEASVGELTPKSSLVDELKVTMLWHYLLITDVLGSVRLTK